ncbi:MAG TPA: sulfite exporter TauE/SafE family protein [Acetobacteraceae bacterium]|jgi:uncharacterized membrane protein YfcA|nr:sulfite exporter TauE/SafE family protein [Acetobacteraceae bacterium]
MNGLAPPLPPARPVAAFACGATVGVLGGLIGLGGAEFRLPLLIGLFALVAHQAVRLNLLVSLATVSAAVVARFGFASFPDLAALAPEIAAVTAGAVVAAWFGTALLTRLSGAALMRLIAALLALVALLLLAESALGLEASRGLPQDGLLRPAVALAAGLGIGLVSSLLGVAGGEFIIPTMMLAFGADVRTAGTASLLISLPTVAVGVLRYQQQGAYRDRSLLASLALPMALGSVAGALLGAALLPFVPVAALKLALGLILAASALKLARKGRR